MKSVRIKLSKDAKEVYDYLNAKAELSKKERSLLKAINYKIELIKNNLSYGDVIAKKLIPDEYLEKYGATNLFRVELADYWRMLYSVTEGESVVEIVAFVLDIIDHDKYNKKFGYKKR